MSYTDTAPNPAFHAEQERHQTPAEHAHMNGKIAFEEHWSLLETLEDSRGFVGGSSHWETFQRQILDLGDERLREMDKNGIEYQIVSLNSPAVQAVLDTRKAIDLARRANDKLAEL